MEKVETISTKVANSTADDYDPWTQKFGEVPSYKTAEEAEQVVAGEATLAIMKAKLTALQGSN
jgi:hypothetical protein